jgi:hypothetical protein
MREITIEDEAAQYDHWLLANKKKSLEASD